MYILSLVNINGVLFVNALRCAAQFVLSLAVCCNELCDSLASTPAAAKHLFNLIFYILFVLTSWGEAENVMRLWISLGNPFNCVQNKLDSVHSGKCQHYITNSIERLIKICSHTYTIHNPTVVNRDITRGRNIQRLHCLISISRKQRNNTVTVNLMGNYWWLQTRLGKKILLSTVLI